MDSDNIAALRAEHEHLSTRMNRVALISFGVTLLLVISLRTGFDRIAELPHYKKLTSAGSEKEPQVILEVLLPWVSVQYFIDRKVDAGDNDLRSLRAAATSIFTREIGVLGGKVEIDVRVALVLLPLVFWASLIYLIVVWFKREAIQRLGEHALQSAADATDVDRLFFHERNSVYAEHPARFAWWCYVAAMAALAAALIRVIAPVLKTINIFNMVWLVSPVAICTAYALMYALALGAVIDDDARVLRGLSPRGRILIRMRDFIARAVDAVKVPAGRIPRIFGMSASTLILLSLVTPFGMTCAGDDFVPAPGYEILNTGDFKLDQGPASWLTAVFARVRHCIGTSAYAVNLLLATATLVALAIASSRGLSRLVKEIATRWIAFAIVLFVLDLGLFFVYVSFSVFEYSLASDLCLPACVLLAATGTTLARSRRQRLRELMRTATLILSPIAVNAIVVAILFIRAGWWGLPLYIAGLLGIALTWHAIDHPAAEAPSIGASER